MVLGVESGEERIGEEDLEDLDFEVFGGELSRDGFGLGFGFGSGDEIEERYSEGDEEAVGLGERDFLGVEGGGRGGEEDEGGSCLEDFVA